MLDLTAPKPITFLISVSLATVGVIVHYTHFHIPYTHSGFSILFTGCAALLFGNLLKEPVGELLAGRKGRRPKPTPSMIILN